MRKHLLNINTDTMGKGIYSLRSFSIGAFICMFSLPVIPPTVQRGAYEVNWSKQTVDVNVSV